MRSYDIGGYLPGSVLSKVDRASMNVALESRTPFLSPDILSIAEKLPSRYCINNIGQKAIIRYILSSVLSNSERDLLFERPKQGFGVGLELFGSGSNEVASEANISFGNLIDVGLVNKDSDALQWMRRGLVSPNAIWAIIVLGQWIGSLSSDDKISFSPI
jgi:asparagine synthase (glutamine-hydrolysing)